MAGSVEAFLRTRALCPDTVPPVVAVAVALLNRHRGRLGAAELAQRLGYGRQYVHRQVSRHLGLPPHTLARLLRFQVVAAAVRAGQQAQIRLGRARRRRVRRTVAPATGVSVTGWNDG
jgi:methylphosphotriester-DNA--protein-cysteine methyltransferase